MEETRVWTLFFLSSVRIYYHCYYYYREENGREFRTKRWLERRKERKKETIARERMPSFRIRIRDENRKLSVAKKRFPSYVISQTCFRAVVFCARRYCRRLAARSRNYSRTDYGNGRGETFFQYHRSFHESRGTRMSVRNGEKSGHSLGIHFPESTIQLCCKKQRKRGKDRLYFLYSRVQNTRSLLSTSCRREKKK